MLAVQMRRHKIKLGKCERAFVAQRVRTMVQLRCATTISYNAAIGSSGTGRHWQTAFNLALELTRHSLRTLLRLRGGGHRHQEFG